MNVDDGLVLVWFGRLELSACLQPPELTIYKYMAQISEDGRYLESMS